MEDKSLHNIWWSKTRETFAAWWTSQESGKVEIKLYKNHLTNPKENVWTIYNSNENIHLEVIEMN